jgi:hypothetical protein
MFPTFNQANKAAIRRRDRHGFEALQLPLKNLSLKKTPD